MRNAIVLAILACSVACAPSGDSDVPPPTPDLQITPSVTDQLTRGFACTGSGNFTSNGTAFLNDQGTLRLQVLRNDDQTPSIHLFVGTRLDAVWAGDSDNCDDVATGNFTAQTLLAGYTATAGDFVQQDDPDGRLLELVDVVLTPRSDDTGGAFESTAEELDALEPVTLPPITLGLVPYTGVPEPLQPL